MTKIHALDSPEGKECSGAGSQSALHRTETGYMNGMTILERNALDGLCGSDLAPPQLVHIIVRAAKPHRIHKDHDHCGVDRQGNEDLRQDRRMQD